MPIITPITFKPHPGMVYRSPMPFALFDHQVSALEEFRQAGVDTVVMLIEEGEDQKRSGLNLKQVYEENNMAVIHYPIVDFATPEDQSELQTVVSQVSQMVREGNRIAVHCFAGQGRTGMFIALLGRQVLGLDGDEAIEWVRKHFKAIETSAQEQVVRDYQPE
jgi:atypical dual specificity phosphatase